MRELYLSRIEYYGDKSARIKRVIGRFYLIRLILFVYFVAFLVLFLSNDYALIYLLQLLLGLGAFIVCVVYDLKFAKRDALYCKYIEINKNELEALNHNLSFNKNGEHYHKLNPHLSVDFDLFGEKSLFNYINRSTTKVGSDKFAKSLVTPIFESETIELRANAIAELAANIEFIQAFQVYGAQVAERGDEVENLQLWIDSDEPKIPLLKLLCWLVPLLNGVVILLLILGCLPISMVSVVFLISLPWVYFNTTKIAKSHNLLGRSAAIFQKYSSLISLIENQEFTSELLVRYKADVVSDLLPASKAIARLKSLLEKFDRRYNLLASLMLNSLYVMDLQNYRCLLEWKASFGRYTTKWFEVIADFDALIGYATFNLNNEQLTCKAVISDDDFEITARNISHPLIPSYECVDNDFKIAGKPFAMVITGANMAGKSTFLRTVVVNLILAMNGARVRASEFRFTPCQILSSIKIQDSLMNKESYFYAELKRLSEILDSLVNEPRSLVILDEMLRGTNTKDKQSGSIGLIEKIIAQKGVVIVATHDLVIGDMEKSYPEIVHNFNFEVELVDDHLKFDYKLKHGITSKFNASFLMKKMGIIN
ncbi:MAG: hypothetical protein R3Y04_01205 [Rikenellaceae bacterium]